jgi:hypothetical protein
LIDSDIGIKDEEENLLGSHREKEIKIEFINERNGGYNGLET